MTEEQKKEMVQEVLDRIMYLPSTKRREFLDTIHDLIEEYPLVYTLNDRGMRVYSNPNFKTEQSCA
jgi:hypothetical protein